MSFEQAFKTALTGVEAEAAELEVPMTELCEEAGVGRATVLRWRARPPKTIRIMTKMQEALARRRAVRA